MLAEHTAYLGAFVVSGVLWRGDLFRDEDGSYWAEHTTTKPDGSWATAHHRVLADNQSDAIHHALMAALECLQRQGFDLKFITVIHHAPGVEGAIKRIRHQSAAPALLQ